MEFKSDELGASFVVPDELTIRHSLKYDSEFEVGRELGFYERLWPAAKTLIEPESWKCKAMSLDVDLDDISNEETLAIIKWAALAVFSYTRAIDATPKN